VNPSKLRTFEDARTKVDSFLGFGADAIPGRREREYQSLAIV